MTPVTVRDAISAVFSHSHAVEPPNSLVPVPSGLPLATLTNVAAATLAYRLRVPRQPASSPTNRRPTMTGHTHRLSKLTLTVLCAGAFAVACKPADRTADTAAARTDSAAGRIDSTAAAKTDSGMNKMASAGTWTADHIFGFDHNANAGEIALGKLASTKGTNAQVKAYGAEMVKDHGAMMKEAHAMFGKMNATADTTWDDAKDLAGKGADKLKELTDKAKGADWDKNYIENEVDMHQKVLDKLQDAAKNTTDSTLAAGLAKTTAKVQEHLTKAQSIKAGLK